MYKLQKKKKHNWLDTQLAGVTTLWTTNFFFFSHPDWSVVPRVAHNSSFSTLEHWCPFFVCFFLPLFFLFSLSLIPTFLFFPFSVFLLGSMLRREILEGNGAVVIHPPVISSDNNQFNLVALGKESAFCAQSNTLFLKGVLAEPLVRLCAVQEAPLETSGTDLALCSEPYGSLYLVVTLDSSILFCKLFHNETTKVCATDDGQVRLEVRVLCSWSHPGVWKLSLSVKALIKFESAVGVALDAIPLGLEAGLKVAIAKPLENEKKDTEFFYPASAYYLNGRLLKREEWTHPRYAKYALLGRRRAIASGTEPSLVPEGAGLKKTSLAPDRSKQGDEQNTAPELFAVRRLVEEALEVAEGEGDDSGDSAATQREDGPNGRPRKRRRAEEKQPASAAVSSHLWKIKSVHKGEEIFDEQGREHVLVTWFPTLCTSRKEAQKLVKQWPQSGGSVSKVGNTYKVTWPNSYVLGSSIVDTEG